MVEAEHVLTSRFTEKLKEEVRTLKEINNKGRTLLKIGVGLVGVFAVGKLFQGESVEASVAAVIAGSGLLLLAKNPLAWTIDTKEALLEEMEEF